MAEGERQPPDNIGLIFSRFENFPCTGTRESARSGVDVIRELNQ